MCQHRGEGCCQRLDFSLSQWRNYVETVLSVREVSPVFILASVIVSMFRRVLLLVVVCGKCRSGRKVFTTVMSATQYWYTVRVGRRSWSCASREEHEDMEVSQCRSTGG